MYRRRYMLSIVTAEGVSKLDKESPKSSSAVKVDNHHSNNVLLVRK
jgi:hypothetical protein